VLFRNLSGELTLLGAYCSHRRDSLEYGIIQADGIRCAYHGWCYDRRGRVVDRPAEPIKTAPNIQHPWYPAKELGGFIFAYLGKDKESPPPLPRYDVLVQNGYRVVERGDSDTGKAYNCNWLQGVENTTDTTHLTYLHGIYDKCPNFKAIEGEYGVKLYILEPRTKQNHLALKKRTVLLLNRKSRELVRKSRNPCDASPRRSGSCRLTIRTAGCRTSPSIEKKEWIYRCVCESSERAREKTVRPAFLRRNQGHRSSRR
jgi:nitrite reductase/ring-hydroxylating ferredoxin subunit